MVVHYLHVNRQIRAVTTTTDEANTASVVQNMADIRGVLELRQSCDCSIR